MHTTGISGSHECDTVELGRVGCCCTCSRLYYIDVSSRSAYCLNSFVTVCFAFTAHCGRLDSSFSSTFCYGGFSQLMALRYIQAAPGGGSICLGEAARPGRQAHRRVCHAALIHDGYFIRPSKFARVTGDRLSLGFLSS